MIDKELLIQLGTKIAEAHLSKDWDLMDELFYEDYIILQTGRVMESKFDVLDSYKSGIRD